MIHGNDWYIVGSIGIAAFFVGAFAGIWFGFSIARKLGVDPYHQSQKLDDVKQMLANLLAARRQLGRIGSRARGRRR